MVPYPVTYVWALTPPPHYGSAADNQPPCLPIVVSESINRGVAHDINIHVYYGNRANRLSSPWNFGKKLLATTLASCLLEFDILATSKVCSGAVGIDFRFVCEYICVTYFTLQSWMCVCVCVCEEWMRSERVGLVFGYWQFYILCTFKFIPGCVLTCDGAYS